MGKKKVMKKKVMKKKVMKKKMKKRMISQWKKKRLLFQKKLQQQPNLLVKKLQKQPNLLVKKLQQARNLLQKIPTKLKNLLKEQTMLAFSKDNFVALQQEEVVEAVKGKEKNQQKKKNLFRTLQY